MATTLTELRKSGPSRDVYNPATGENIGSVTLTDPSDVEAVVASAHQAQRLWRKRSFVERAKIFTRFHDRMIDDADRILDTIQRESGKSRRDALAELTTAIGTVRYYVAHGKAFIKPRRHQSAVPLVTSAQVVRKPVGVAGFITPWNYPFLLGIGDCVPALLAGNAVVIKPSELAPLSVQLALDLLAECGLPAEIAQVVNGPGSKVGNELIQHVDYVAFTGSTETGRKIAVAAAERLIPCSLELGGKNPMIVLEDAPLESAVTGLLNGAFANSGQACIAIERAYVHDKVFDAFAEQVAERARAMNVGWALDWNHEMGSLITADHARDVEAKVKQAVDQGATVLAGGRRLTNLGDSFFEPTVLTDVAHDLPLACHETFGPVVALHRVESEFEAVRLANDSNYGLNASVWTASTSRARAVARSIDSGSAVVNSTMMIFHSFDVPMGGVKHSGLGRRHGRQGIERFTDAQSIVSGPAFKGGYDSIQRLMTNPRRARLLLNTFRLMRHIPGLR